MTIRVLVVDDHTLFRTALLQTAPDTEVVGVVGTGTQAISQAEQHAPPPLPRLRPIAVIPPHHLDPLPVPRIPLSVAGLPVGDDAARGRD